MAKKDRNNTKILIFLELLLVFSTLSLLIINYILDKKIEKPKDNYQLLFNYYNELVKEIDEKKENAINLEYKINNIKDVSFYKSEYFNSIKDLEDRILANKSDIKIAYLTFDDGPYYNTYKVLDILDKYDVKATFFTTSINGNKCYDNKNYDCFKLYEEYEKRGHTIANHTYTHAIRKGLYSSVDSFINSLKKQENHVKKYANGYVTNIVRFPGGSGSAGKLKGKIKEKLREIGYGWVDWNGNDGDGGILKSKDQARKNFYNSINEKIEVILFHDYSKYTTSLLPEFIEYLQNQGYIMLPLFYESNMINK